MEKAAKPLKIFISYGHEIDVTDSNGQPLYPEPNNESVVRKIKAYLESRGHTVWLDTDQIKEGKDWRRKIYEGVEESNVVIVCLSRKAMKPNGVCRDEIAIAIGVCGRNLFPVKLEDSSYPSYLKSYQFITDFQEWSSHISADTIDETWLDQNLEKLAKLLEEENVRLYYDEIVELKNLLKPWNMNSRLKKLDSDIIYHYNEKTKETEKTVVNEFCGRESLFKMFEEQLVQGGEAVRKESQRVLWLRKGPGFGKSRFAAELHYNYCYAIRAAYFIEYNQPESFKPQTFVKSVAFQLAQANNSYRKKLLEYLKENLDNINLQTGDPQTLFKTLIVNQMVNDIDGDNGTQWILVDALDEATVDGRNEIASLISQNIDNLPSWICFFITSRDSDSAVNRNFTQFSPIEFSDEENKSNVREYILNEIDKRGITVQGDPEELVNILHEKSEGTFLYPEMVFRDLTEDSISLDDIRSLPSGVLGYIHKRFNYLYGNNIELYDCNVRPMLGYILTSCEPIPRGVLKYCLGIERDSEFNKRLKLLGTFFIHSGTTDKDTIVPFHKSIKDYCFDIEKSTEDYCIYPNEANEDFANCGLELFKTGVLQWTTRTDEEPNALQRYFLNWLPSHWMNANMKKEAATVLSDFAFLMKRLRYGNVERAILDYILFRNQLNRISSDSEAFVNVICSNTHYLRRNSEDNSAYKIMLQIATEVADECPVTQAAEQWLNPKEGDSPCDWFWLNKVKRPKEYQPSPCKLVIENAGRHVLLLPNDDVLSWGIDDHNLRIFDLQTGFCKAILEGHTDSIIGATELRSGNILSWSRDNTLRIWSPNGTCKAVLEGHTSSVYGAIELRSDDILSWSDDKTLRLWSPDRKCKAVLEGHTAKVTGAIELRSGDILSWSNDKSLRLWNPNGTDKAVLKDHTNWIHGATELSSGDILSWSEDTTLRLWSPDGECKAALKGHTDGVKGAMELNSGNILSWCRYGSHDRTMRLWSSDGKCIANWLGGGPFGVLGAIEIPSGDILSWNHRKNDLRLWSPKGVGKQVPKGHTNWVNGVRILCSGDILSWSQDRTLRLWSSDMKICKAILEGHTDGVLGAIELPSGEILSWSLDGTLRLWSPNMKMHKAVLEKHFYNIETVKELSSGNILSWGANEKNLYLWSLNGDCKLLEGHTGYIDNAIELSTGYILTKCRMSTDDHTFRLWSPNGECKAVLEGHIGSVFSAQELCSGAILAWSNWDTDLHLWSSDGTYKCFLKGHVRTVEGVLELCSGDVLSWSLDKTMRLWSPDGECKAVLEGHKDYIKGVLELRSGDILSWDNHTMRLWSPNGTFKAVLKGHKDYIKGVLELSSGDILSWSDDNSLRLWSPDGVCKAVLEGHTDWSTDVKELRSGNILSWDNHTMRLWSPNGTFKAVMQYKDYIKGVFELRSGEILSWSDDNSLRLWSPDVTCNEVIKSDNPKYDSYYALLHPKRVYEQFYAKETNLGIGLQHVFKPIVQWNSSSCNSRFLGDGRICVWYGHYLDFLQLNYGNHKSITFDQVHQLLTGEIDESKLVEFVPQPEGTGASKTE